MVLLRNLSHFQCRPVVASEPQLSVCAWTDPSIGIGFSSERPLLSSQIRALALCAIATESGTVHTSPRSGQRQAMTLFNAGALSRTDIPRAWLCVCLGHLQTVSHAQRDTA